MSSQLQRSTETERGRSLPARRPQLATAAVFAILFVASVGSLYATTQAIASGQRFATITLVGSTWFGSVVVLALIARPHFHRLKAGTTDLPDDLRTTVESACSRHGVTLRDTVATAESPGFRLAEIAGLLPWNRHLVVDGWFFASLSAAEREALLAREAYLARNRHLSFVHLAGPAILAASSATVLVVSVLVPLTTTGLEGGLLAGLSLVLFVVATRRGTETMHAADRYAARRTTPEAMAGLLERAETNRDATAWDRWPLAWLTMRPTTERRLVRLARDEET